jgi:hypothetical protein
MKKTTINFLLIALLMTGAPAQAATKLSNNKNSKDSCKNIKTNYKSEIMSKWSNGLASDTDVLKEIELNIKMLEKQKKITNDKIKKNINVWIKAENDTKNALKEQDVKLITNSLNLKILTINKFNKICELEKNK